MKILKDLAVCLLILALPVQGFAAASQAFCHTQKSEVVKHVEQSSHAHKHEQTADHQHDSHHADATTSKLSHKCSNCLQCCAGYAIVSFSPTTIAVVATEPVLVEIKPVMHGIVSPLTLERPPRFLIV